MERKPYPRALREELKAMAWEMEGRGLAQTTIAAELSKISMAKVGRKVSQPTVHRILLEKFDAVSEEMERIAKAAIYAKYRQAECLTGEVFEAWFKSKATPKKKTKSSGSSGGKTKGADPDGKATSASVELTEREGEAVWIDKIAMAIRLGVEILDKIAPPKPPAKADDDAGKAGTVTDAVLAQAEARALAFTTDEHSPEDATTDE